MENIEKDEERIETIDKTGLEQKEIEDLFHRLIAEFKLRWLNKGTEISKAGLYNYAMSIMAYEFHNRFDKETSKKLVDQYKP